MFVAERIMPGEPDPIPSFGEPACPACGYVRTGVEHRAACPECGGPGFECQVLVFGAGEPPVGRAWHDRRRSFVKIVGLAVILAVPAAIPSFVPGLPPWLRGVLGYLVAAPVLLGVLAGLLGWSLVRSWRARDDESITSAVWQVTGEGITVHERGGGRYFASEVGILRVDAIGDEVSMIVQVWLNPLIEPPRSFQLHPDPRRSLMISVDGDRASSDRLVAALESVLRVPIRRRHARLDAEDEAAGE